MIYYILMEGETESDLWDENILGEESFGKFYTGNGFIALNKMVQSEPEALQNVKIIDEKKKSYTITEFLDIIRKWKIMLDR
jgi:hypothetical protein|tara:strand:- start:1268 stop:1510 length:243 start_codon:yes stop_codon:yes gene_type:complete